MWPATMNSNGINSTSSSSQPSAAAATAAAAAATALSFGIYNLSVIQSGNNISNISNSGSNNGNMSKLSSRSSSSSGYHQKAMEEIHNSLLPFAKPVVSTNTFDSCAASTISQTSGIGSMVSSVNGIDAVLKQAVLQLNSETHIQYGYNKLIRKSSMERDGGTSVLQRNSPALDSGAGSSRSDSPRLSDLHSQMSRQYSPNVFSEQAIAHHYHYNHHHHHNNINNNSNNNNNNNNQQQQQQQQSQQPPPLPPPRLNMTPPPPPPLPPSSHLSMTISSAAANVIAPSSTSVASGTVSTPLTNYKRISPPSKMLVNQQPQTQSNSVRIASAITPPTTRTTTIVGTVGMSCNGSAVTSSIPTTELPPPPYPFKSTSPSIAVPVTISCPVSVPTATSMTASTHITVPLSPLALSSAMPLPVYPNRQSPTQTPPIQQQPLLPHSEYRKSPSSGVFSTGGSPLASSPSPTSSRSTPSPTCALRPSKTQNPVVQSVKSNQVQKPVLQTAIAPTVPQVSTIVQMPPPYKQSIPITASVVQLPPSLPPQPSPHVVTAATPNSGLNASPSRPPPPLPSHHQQQPPPPLPPPSTHHQPPVSPSILVVPTTEPPSYASTMQAFVAQRAITHCNSPFNLDIGISSTSSSAAAAAVAVAAIDSQINRSKHLHHSPLQRKFSPIHTQAQVTELPPTPPPRSDSPHALPPPLPPPIESRPPAPLPNEPVDQSQTQDHVTAVTVTKTVAASEGNGSDKKARKVQHESPIPERKKFSKEKEDERRDCIVRNYSPQAYKFFMEQHIENVLKAVRQRTHRRMQLENEMAKINLSPEIASQMRKMLSQKESNYIRLRRAKMNRSMFERISTIGVGAFGEVSLVRKTDSNIVYAMKTLRKADVLKRNQVAHVKAERDILAEADNEWVVKLYFSFQDRDNLYFVMDFIPGGDLMSLLIKKGIFEETLACFYVAELTCALESVHKMGFIHRDIKPDNILIDEDGHIKLTDFGLCTGFRWTHNSKYYQKNEHDRQNSMDPIDNYIKDCDCAQLKPLERRRRREHVRCLAHSLVGTPNYIAPEVLQRSGYTQLCDWWSVGVILYEMLVGSPPFLANTPAETQYKVVNWDRYLKIPSMANLSVESKDLILKLLVSADRRLGKSAREIKSHPFFVNIDFEKGLREQRAPYIPFIKNAYDTSNFDPVDPDRLRNSEASHSPHENGLNSDGEDDESTRFHGFFEFTFRRFFDDKRGDFNQINKLNKLNFDYENSDNSNETGIATTAGTTSASGAVYV